MTRKTGISGSIVIALLLLSAAVSQAFAQRQDSTLSAMNRTQKSLFTTLEGGNRSGKPYKVLIIGNSLTWHSPSEKIGWLLTAGMAASAPEKDYVHLLHQKMTAAMPDRHIVFRIANLALFERNYGTYDFQRLDSLRSFRPDLLIFQIGENVSLKESADLSGFEARYTELISVFKNDGVPNVICTTPFFPSLPKTESIKRVVGETGSFLVDLSHLVLLDKENFARDEVDYPGNRQIWKSAGIGTHPGDKGMKSIAEAIYIPIHALQKQSKSH